MELPTVMVALLPLPVLAGAITISKSSTIIDLTGSSLPAVSLPMKDAIGLPMSGKLDFAVAEQTIVIRRNGDDYFTGTMPAA